MLNKIANHKGPTPSAAMIKELKKLNKKENLIFIKLEPNVRKSEKIIKLLKNSGAVLRKTLFTPTTFWIDLTPPEEDIFKKFSSKTRLVNFSTKETRLHTHPFPLLHGSEPG